MSVFWLSLKASSHGIIISFQPEHGFECRWQGHLNTTVSISHTWPTDQKQTEKIFSSVRFHVADHVSGCSLKDQQDHFQSITPVRFSDGQTERHCRALRPGAKRKCESKGGGSEGDYMMYLFDFFCQWHSKSQPSGPSECLNPNSEVIQRATTPRVINPKSTVCIFASPPSNLMT